MPAYDMLTKKFDPKFELFLMKKNYNKDDNSFQNKVDLFHYHLIFHDSRTELFDFDAEAKTLNSEVTIIKKNLGFLHTRGISDKKTGDNNYWMVGSGFDDARETILNFSFAIEKR